MGHPEMYNKHHDIVLPTFRKPARKDDDDTYGTAPWMGTLR